MGTIASKRAIKGFELDTLFIDAVAHINKNEMVAGKLVETRLKAIAKEIKKVLEKEVGHLGKIYVRYDATWRSIK